MIVQDLLDLLFQVFGGAYGGTAQTAHQLTPIGTGGERRQSGIAHNNLDLRRVDAKLFAYQLHQPGAYTLADLRLANKKREVSGAFQPQQCAGSAEFVFSGL